jgi:hypothetical protein
MVAAKPGTGGSVSIEGYRIRVRSGVSRGLVEKHASVAINHRATFLRYSIGIEGGYLTAEIGMASDAPGWVVGELPTPMDIQFHDDITITRGGVTVWEGRVVEREFGAGGLVTGVICEGYFGALNDNWSRDTSTSDITSGEALESIFAAIAPNVRIGTTEQWTDPLVMHEETLVQTGTDAFGAPVYANRGGMYDFYRMTGGEAVALVLKEGNTAKQPLAFMILSEMTAHLFALAAPAEAEYTTAFDPERMTWRESVREMVSHILIEYQVELNTSDQTYEIAMTTEAETAGFLAAHGFEKHLFLPAGTMTPSGAIALRDTELTRRSQPQVQATITLSADPATWLARGMSRWPYYAVLPGKWVTVAGRGTQPIIAVTVDATAETAELELGELSSQLPKNLMIKERRARWHWERMLSLVSGTKVR